MVMVISWFGITSAKVAVPRGTPPCVNTRTKLPVGSPRSVNDPSSATVVVMGVPWTVTTIGTPPAPE
jgi:hypothetical protein